MNFEEMVERGAQGFWDAGFQPSGVEWVDGKERPTEDDPRIREAMVRQNREWARIALTAAGVPELLERAERAEEEFGALADIHFGTSDALRKAERVIEYVATCPNGNSVNECHNLMSDAAREYLNDDD